MRTTILLVLAVLSFLAAAKLHGRQLRLERVAQGHLSVRFDRPNAPWVEARWKEERRHFALGILVVVALALAAAPIAFSLGGGASLKQLALAAVLHGPTTVFLVLALLSLRHNWAAAAPLGAVAWLALSVSLGSAARAVTASAR